MPRSLILGVPGGYSVGLDPHHLEPELGAALHEEEQGLVPAGWWLWVGPRHLGIMFHRAGRGAVFAGSLQVEADGLLGGEIVEVHHPPLAAMIIELRASSKDNSYSLSSSWAPFSKTTIVAHSGTPFAGSFPI